MSNIIIGGAYTPGGSCFGVRGILLKPRDGAPFKETCKEACDIARSSVCPVAFTFGVPGKKVFFEVGPQTNPEDIYRKYLKMQAETSQSRKIY